jgi:hypothetical protein
MVQALASILVVLGVGAWIVAAVSLWRAVALVPRGQRLSALFSSGWWQFEKLRALGGPGVDVQLQRYVWAFGVFFVVIACGIVLGAVSMGLAGGGGVTG